ncbi:MAG: TIGR00296 family protein [Candidatus Pacearchaeota archaeon]|nr:TIGR00296 family protein [Candidatus Pacearchaeota archaeon]
MVTAAQGQKLIKLAHASIDTWFKKKQLEFSKEKKEFKKKQGVFVTLYNFPDKTLRGCIGFPYPTLPLAEAVFQCARSAAFSDPRFEPLTEEEFKHCVIEISVLTIPKEINSKGGQIPNEIKVGRDGLIVHFGGYSGLLLPQVAKEMCWNPIEFLRGTCNKACLPGETWLNPLCKIYTFQAQIFSEATPKGEVIKHKERVKKIK